MYFMHRSCVIIMVPSSCSCYLVQKLQERQTTLKRSTLPERQKAKWSKVVIADMMLSEESDGVDDDSIIVKPLPWRSAKVSKFFKNLDIIGAEGKTCQAMRQRCQRVISSAPSNRPKPTVSLPDWAYISMGTVDMA